MVSPSGRYVLIYNAETDNHRELRNDLVDHGTGFRARSATEVLLAAIEQWGLEVASRRSVGMFAASCWDRRARRPRPFRDRMGEKPLYVARAPGASFFASELSALTAWAGLGRTLDPVASAAFFQRGYVPAPLTIRRQARRLAPGMVLDLSVEDLDRSGTPFDRARCYWSLAEVAAEARDNPLRMSDAEALAACARALLESAVGQSIADAPAGVFLSGRGDSSLVLARLQRVTGRPARTFTIGFARDGFEKTATARRVARHLGAEHTDLEVTPEDALGIVPRLATVYGEPYADPSPIPTRLAAERARRYVTVARSGDGADEMFGGHDRYLAAGALALLLVAPAPPRRFVSAGVDALGGGRLERPLLALPARLRSRLATTTSGDRPRKLAAVLTASDLGALARRRNSVCDDPTELLAHVPWAESPDHSSVGPVARLDLQHSMILDDARNWLPDDILVEVARATIAVSTESRAPFLDHRIVALAWRLPLQQKIRQRRSKWVLRRILATCLPPDLVDRPKMGFRPPLGAWLRGPLRAWAESLLESRALARSGLLRERAVRSCRREHLDGGRARADRLCSVLVRQACLKEQTRSAGVAASREVAAAADIIGTATLAGAAA